MMKAPMTAPELDERALLPPVREIARRAGMAILPWYQARPDVVAKADGSPVTEADHAADAVIRAALAALTPGVPIVTEEQVAIEGAPALGSGDYWLVDPLDGTKEFIKGDADFTVNIALIRDRRPVLGVVFAPATGEIYSGAGPGTALFCDEDGEESAIAVRPTPADGLVVVSSRSHATPDKLDAFLSGRTVKHNIARGSSLKFCEVARGAADIYPRFGPTCEWDTAAGHAVLLAAGGEVVRADDGTPLLYGKPDFLNPGFIARKAS